LAKLGFNFRFVHRDRNNNILYDSGFLPNHVTDDGFEMLYDVFFRGATAPTAFEIGLAQNSLGKTSSIGDITEVTGTGYSRKAVDRDDTASGFPTLELDQTDMQISSVEVNFENTGETAWDSAEDGFLASTGEVALICYRPLAQTRTLHPGDTLDVTINVKGLHPPEE